MDDTQLADFLRRCRDRLSPEQAGLPRGPRRRVPGLRRQELAQLTGMSADYLMRLEQGRGPQPSVQLLTALARGLRLSEDERDHLFLVAGHRPPAGRYAGEHVRPGLLHLLDQLKETPAQILTDLGDVIVQNPMAEALLGCVCTVRGRDRNIVWRWFTDAETREPYPPRARQEASRTHVADLRAATARRGDDEASRALVGELLRVSEEFARLWKRHEVARRHASRIHVCHPVAGLITLDSEPLLTPAEDQWLHIFTPTADSAGGRALRLLKKLDPALVHAHHRPLAHDAERWQGDPARLVDD
ncbi:helix-turn-helix transcriptional regulator [Saccharomonospora sp. NPDC006951]